MSSAWKHVSGLYCVTFLLHGPFLHSNPARPVDFTDDAQVESATFRTIENPSLQNLIQVSENLYSGGEPVGESGFQTLSKLGIRTIISVDGARPDLQRAEERALRYVHIPVGYDGISEEASLSIVRAIQEAPKPIYIHCHHGIHRGPAAAAIALLASDECDPETAIQFMKDAGTSEDYAGLWRDVRTFTPPASDTPLPELVSVAPVGDMANAMSIIDRAYDNLKRFRDNDWQTPEDHADLSATQEALILKETLRETARTLSHDYGHSFTKQLAAAESIAGELETALLAKDPKTPYTKMQSLKRSCVQCHREFRD